MQTPTVRLDAHKQRRIFTCLKEILANIAKTVPKIDVHLGSAKASEKSFEVHNACRLIFQNENPGIGVREFLCRVIGKYVIKHIENNLRSLAVNV